LLHSSLRKPAIAAGIFGMLALSGCHKKTPAPQPPPPPAATATQPTASITASPNVINRGQSTVLNWKTTDATTATISGIGTVPANGTENVSPRDSTTFTITATGPGGNATSSAEVTVNREVPPAPMTPTASDMTDEQLFEHNVKDIYFDYDRYNLQPADKSTIESDAAFLQQHASLKIVIEGHCDDRGSEEYNLALGQDRALAVKEALVTDGISGSRIEIISLGKEKPFCTTEDDACWHENRRAHFRMAGR
jgi:peptidoglycan-associated lipoprotein